MRGMGDRRALFATTVAITVLAAAPPVWAQPEPEPEVEMEGDAADAPAPVEPDPAAKAEAKKLLAGGDTFFKKGDYQKRKKRPADAKAQYERALAAYTKAYELVPNPKILFPIASAEQELERWVDAATHYRQFLAQATDADAKLRADAEQRLETVKLSIGVLALAITPEGAQVALDGNPVGTAPLAEPLFVAPGEYTLSITADGYHPFEQKVTIEAGSESERTFDLEQVKVIIEPPRPPPVREVPPPPEAPSKLVLYVGGGLTVAMLGGTVATGLIAVGKSDTFHDETKSARTREDARTSGKNLALVSDALLAGTVVAAGVTAYYYLKIYKPKTTAHARELKEYRESNELSRRDDRGSREVTREMPKVLVAPWVQADAGGLAITGLLW